MTATPPKSPVREPRVLAVRTDRSNPWFDQIVKTVLLPDRAAPDVFYSFKPPDYVSVLAQTADGRIVLVRQWRPAVEEFLFELPAGHVDPGETPVEAARRELAEETGATAGEIVSLGPLVPDSGRLENRLWPFYAGGLTVPAGPRTGDEISEVRLFALDELAAMIARGELRHVYDLAVLVLAQLRGLITLPPSTQAPANHPHGAPR